MSNAASRQEAQERLGLVEALKRADQGRLSEYVIQRGLPSQTGKWTIEQLTAAVAKLTGRAAPTTKEEPVALKNKGGRAAASAAAIVAYLISVPDGSADQPTVRSFGSVEDATAAAEKQSAGQTSFVVSSPKDLENLGSETLLALYNRTRETPVTKFSSATTAREEVFKSLGESARPAGRAGKQQAAAGAKETAKESKPAKAKREAKAREPRARKPLARDPKAAKDVRPVRAGTKLARLIDLVFRKNGATVEEIEAELSKNGRPVEAASWLGYSFNTVAGYGYRSDNGRVFGVLPKGMSAPHPHVIAGNKEKAAKAEKKAGVRKGGAARKGGAKAAK